MSSNYDIEDLLAHTISIHHDPELLGIHKTCIAVYFLICSEKNKNFMLVEKSAMIFRFAFISKGIFHSQGFV